MMKTRRSFMLQSAGITTGLLTGGIREAFSKEETKPDYCYFTKHFIGLDFEKLADISAELGVNGIEAPIRPGGHVQPERVEEDLPKLAEALKKRGLKISIMTSGINEVSAAQNTEKVLRTAKALGVKHYRMLYNKYDLSKPIMPQLEEWRAKFRDLIALSKEIGIQPLYQNHSGKDYLGAPVWDVYSLMKDYSPAEWAFAFDIYHATVEGSMSWPLEFNLVRDRIGAAYFKNFKWGAKKAEACPLGEGFVNKDYAVMLKKINFTGPVALHVEYLEGSVKDPAYVEEAIKATRRDFAVLKEWWA